MSAALKVVGADVPRRDARQKVTGGAVYAADVQLPGMLHVKLLRSPHAHARVKSIDASEALALRGVRAVLTRDDLASYNHSYGYFIKDQPILALDKVRFIGDTVVAVAAETEAVALAATRLIAVEYEPLAAAATIETALAPNAPQLFEQAPQGAVPRYGAGASGELRPRGNVCYQFNYTTGSAAAFANCDHVFEDTFVFSRMQHFHLEPFVTVAKVDGDQVELWTSCQSPFPVRRELARLFKLPESKIRVNVPFVGGSFGAKNACRTEPIAVLIALKTRRPVRLCLSIDEGFLTQSQHAAVLKLKTGVGKDGRFVARQSVIYLDAGAYSDASPLVAEKAGYRIPGPYHWDYIDTQCLCVLTNTTPAGPFRGFGGTQAGWACESQIDMIARRLGMDPYELRIKNLVALGEPFVPGESGMDSDLKAGLDLICREIGYHGRRKRREGSRRTGMGIAIGFKDGGGVHKPAQARVKVSSGGDVFLLCGAVEMGQGASTALCQIVAEVLNVPMTRVTYTPVNTDASPFDMGTNASSAVAVMGQAVERAAREARRAVLEFAAEQLNCPLEQLSLDDGGIVREGKAVQLGTLVTRCYGGPGFEFQGDGYFRIATDPRAPLHAQCVFWEIGWAGAEVEVDEETGSVRVLQLVTSGDTGRSINKLLCQGQEEGGAVMGLGQALFERMLYDGAQLVNGNALAYRLPLATDLPPRFVAITQEQGHGPGPFGAKGAGEATLVPVASAIANAVEDAVGVRITDLPITPEKVLSALRER